MAYCMLTLYKHKTITLKISTIFMTEFQFKQRKITLWKCWNFNLVQFISSFTKIQKFTEKKLCKYLKSYTQLFINSILKLFKCLSCGANIIV